MKKQFFDLLLQIMRENKKVCIVFVGLGWPRVDEFKHEFPDRAIDVHASEQTALDIAVGLSYWGKIPFVYTITPFFFRGFETIRTYINHENLNVKLVGAGRNDDYSKEDGFSHDAQDIETILDTQNNFRLYFPETLEALEGDMYKMVDNEGPEFLSLRR